VVRDPSGRRRDDCFFSTDRTLKPTQLLENFALRWPLEVCFENTTWCTPSYVLKFQGSVVLNLSVMGELSAYAPR